MSMSPSDVKKELLIIPNNFTEISAYPEDIILLLEKFTEIIRQVQLRKPSKLEIVYRYKDLLDAKRNLFTPEKAHQAGLLSTEDDMDTAYLSYIKAIAIDPSNNSIFIDIQNLYMMIKEILHSDIKNADHLIADFTDFYRLCYLSPEKNARTYFNYGFVCRPQN